MRLIELLRQGEFDAATMALPIPEHGLTVQPLYDEEFVVALPKHHHWADHAAIYAHEIKNETMLLLGNGRCFGDQVLEFCPEMSRFSTACDGIARSFEGSSLETIRHTVASGIGITVLPKVSIPDMDDNDGMLRYVTFTKPLPSRRVVIAWRKIFTRYAAIESVRQAVLSCNLNGAHMLHDAPVIEG